MTRCVAYRITVNGVYRRRGVITWQSVPLKQSRLAGWSFGTGIVIALLTSSCTTRGANARSPTLRSSRSFMALRIGRFIHSSFVRNSHLFYNNCIHRDKYLVSLNSSRRPLPPPVSFPRKNTRKISFIYSIRDFWQGQPILLAE